MFHLLFTIITATIITPTAALAPIINGVGSTGVGLVVVVVVEVVVELVVVVVEVVLDE